MQKEIEIKSDIEDIRLDNFLCMKKNELSRSKIQKMIKEGLVFVNGERQKASYKVVFGDCIKIIEDDDIFFLKPQNIPLNIIFEDEHFIVLNKQKKLLTHPTANNLENTLVNALLYHFGDNLSDIDNDPLRRGIVHRLDKNTAGLMVVAKTNEAHINLAKQIKEKTLIRKYIGVVYGEIDKDYGIIDEPLRRSLKETVKIFVTDKADPKGKLAITHFKVLERFTGATYMEFELKTGRTHQIRCHMAHIHHTLVGDTLYGSKGFKHKLLDKVKTNEQVLQSYYIKLAHPISGDIMEFELAPSDWDKDIINVLKILRENNL